MCVSVCGGYCSCLYMCLCVGTHVCVCVCVFERERVLPPIVVVIVFVCLSLYICVCVCLCVCVCVRICVCVSLQRSASNSGMLRTALPDPLALGGAQGLPELAVGLAESVPLAGDVPQGAPQLHRVPPLALPRITCLAQPPLGLQQLPPHRGRALLI